MQDATRQLKDTSFYINLTIILTLGYNTKINAVIYEFEKQNLTTEKTVNSLKLGNPKQESFTLHLKFISKEILGDLLLTQSISRM